MKVIVLVIIVAVSLSYVVHRYDCVLFVKHYGKPYPYSVIVRGISLKRGVPNDMVILTNPNRWLVINMESK